MQKGETAVVTTVLLALPDLLLERKAYGVTAIERVNDGSLSCERLPRSPCFNYTDYYSKSTLALCKISFLKS